MISPGPVKGSTKTKHPGTVCDAITTPFPDVLFFLKDTVLQCLPRSARRRRMDFTRKKIPTISAAVETRSRTTVTPRPIAATA